MEWFYADIHWEGIIGGAKTGNDVCVTGEDRSVSGAAGQGALIRRGNILGNRSCDLTPTVGYPSDCRAHKLGVGLAKCAGNE